MKSPSDLASQLAKQWHRPDLRVSRLLDRDSWPLTLNIGKPTASQVLHQTLQVQQHLHAWRAMAELGNQGTVEYDEVSYRSTAAPVRLPVRWVITSPSQWIAATNDKTVALEFRQLCELVAAVSPVYRQRLVRERSLWLGKSVPDVIQLCQLADQLEPGIGQGRPLRLLSGFGVDTKLIERNQTTLQKLLDERFNGTVSEQGLITFLDAAADKDHWLLIKPLCEGLLPFRRLRLTTSEIAAVNLPASRLIVVENEQCEHLLPELADTIAILGAGLDLGWLDSPTLADKQILYWGDMDSWGLLMLARARQYCPSIKPVLMNRAAFEEFAPLSAVIEPVSAQPQAPAGLTACEAGFYRYLSTREKGRLEQEFIPQQRVRTELLKLIVQGPSE
ncbi:DUF3322 domain-containing protein [Parathalassolituus penaei]|uniref:DUF2220 family protein n=1 Tax=Parathalassolituus penaei TaxID=2997323 RepID=A0A9X3ISR6_9GAMM|nr:DUF3322 domain-containing protein [Parathalassolituus penaei]MCY0966111.1 DUF2220 family protein [Parathalassolituus penaei]